MTPSGLPRCEEKEDAVAATTYNSSFLSPQRVVTSCLGYGLKYADDLSCLSLRATDGRNRVNSNAVNTMLLPTACRP
ncbi:hypothetical protein PIB30_025903 [Stylosanthes scabra]|uniref:Uncharacterized protein n=1 Tax=Stylosanthes scabra TaxID=79078 RepID=A0ABU6YC47_9FABA|nr:hypothetical protein [Stylosanthes scabra]